MAQRRAHWTAPPAVQRVRLWPEVPATAEPQQALAIRAAMTRNPQPEALQPEAAEFRPESPPLPARAVPERAVPERAVPVWQPGVVVQQRAARTRPAGRGAARPEAVRA